MDRQTIDDHHMVARYLADQLSDADREAFEAYCREHPEVYREIEAAARLKVGLAKLGETARLEPLLADETGRGGGAFAFRHAAAIGGLMISGALGAVFVLTRASVIGPTVADVSGRFGAALPVSTSYEFVRMRETRELDQHIVLPSSPGAIELRVLPDEEGAASYRATLTVDTATGTKPVATATGLVPDEQHYVTVFVNSEKLAPGTYSLTVEPAGATAKVPAFRFEARAP